MSVKASPAVLEPVAISVRSLVSVFSIEPDRPLKALLTRMPCASTLDSAVATSG
jgi:hypothetical protein